MVVHAFKARTQETEAGISLWVHGQPGLQSSRTDSKATQRNPISKTKQNKTKKQTKQTPKLSGVITQVVNPSTLKSDTGRSQSLMPDWSIDKFQGEPSLHSKSNHWKQNAGKREVNKNAMFQPQQAAALGIFGYMVLTWESRKEERHFWIFLGN